MKTEELLSRDAELRKKYEESLPKKDVLVLKEVPIAIVVDLLQRYSTVSNDVSGTLFVQAETYQYLEQIVSYLVENGEMHPEEARVLNSILDGGGTIRDPNIEIC